MTPSRFTVSVGPILKTFILFKERIPDAVIHTLDLNYRSTQEILDLSNWLLAHSQSIIKTVTGSSWQRTKATTPFVW